MKIGRTPEHIPGPPFNRQRVGSLENVQKRDPNRDHRETLRALETITKELMEKHNKKDDAAGVNDLKRWPVDSDAVKFLAATESVNTVDELRKVRLPSR